MTHHACQLGQVDNVAVVAEGDRIKNCRVLLFNDLLLVGKPHGSILGSKKNKKLRVRYTLDLEGCEIVPGVMPGCEVALSVPRPRLLDLLSPFSHFFFLWPR